MNVNVQIFSMATRNKMGIIMEVAIKLVVLNLKYLSLNPSLMEGV